MTKRRGRCFLPRDCFLDTVSLDTLATATATNKFRLCALARSSVSPHQFLVSVRVALARLLAVGTSPSETAAVSGFADQRHLNRHFRHRFGITPTATALTRQSNVDGGRSRKTLSQRTRLSSSRPYGFSHAATLRVVSEP